MSGERDGDRTKSPSLEAALSLHRAGRVNEAIDEYERLVDLEPTNAKAWSNLGVALRSRGKRAAALVCHQRAAALEPSTPGVLGNLGNVLKDLGRYHEAIVAHRSAVASAPRDPGTHHNLAVTLRAAGELETARAEFELAHRLDPASAAIEFDLSQVLLQLGRLEEGLAAYEARWRLPEMRSRTPNGRRWEGAPFEGRTLLLRREQGFGDSILASRYLPAVKRLGGEVAMECKPELRTLFRSLDGVDRFVDPGGDSEAFDLHCPLMSLPFLFGTTTETIPPPVALRVPRLEDARLKALLERSGPRMRVGVVWSGSVTFKGNATRATQVERFLELGANPGVQLYSLQKGPLERQLAESGARSAMIEVGPHFRDFAETAAFVRELDLVIMTDSAVAHLASSLGVPVWNLLGAEPYWIYGTTGERTPWYPGMCLFRSGPSRNWAAVFDAVRRRLAEAARLHREGRWPPGADESARSAPESVRPAPSALLLARSAFRRPDGSPRFDLPIALPEPRDPGLRVLAVEEQSLGGFEYPTRRVLDDHLEPGDLVIDVGAHWGVYSLQAATRHPGQIDVLAVEAHPANAAQLLHAVRANGLEDQIEVVCAAAGAEPGLGPLVMNTTMGHSLHGHGLEGAPDFGSLTVAVVRLDDLVASRSEFRERRIVIKIDVEGSEPEVVAGARGLIESGRVAAIVWEYGRAYYLEEDVDNRRGKMLEMVRWLRQAGYSLYRFPHPRMGGQLLPFAPTFECFNVFALAQGVSRRSVYPKPGFVREPLPAPARAPTDAEKRSAATRILQEWRATDAARWADFEAMKPGAFERARAASRFIEPGSKVLDLGAGVMALDEVLADACEYTPADLVPWREDTRLIDLNEQRHPEGRFDVIVAVALLEHLHEPEATLRRAVMSAPRLVVGYPIDEPGAPSDRRARGFFNDYQPQELEELLEACGWQISDRAMEEGLLYLSCARA